MNQIKDYLALYPHLGKSYFLIGLLEITLRESIPLTLRNYHHMSREQPWYEGLLLNAKGEAALSSAISIDSSHPEQYLTLPFWRYLFSSKNYGSLWLPVLHQVFSELKEPKDISTFRIVDKHFDTALRLRNNVAHYNLDIKASIEFSGDKVIWLLRNLGIDDASLVKA